MEATIERVFEPSHVRRGRLSTTPTWYVTTATGERWKFTRKVDAARFINFGCECAVHCETTWRCTHCLGWRVESRAPSSPLCPHGRRRPSERCLSCESTEGV